jgi:hypothetical protein
MDHQATLHLVLLELTLQQTVTVAAYDSTVIDIKQPLAATETITGGASAITINFHISGVEIA